MKLTPFGKLFIVLVALGVIGFVAFKKYGDQLLSGADDLRDVEPEGLERGLDDLPLHFERRRFGQALEQFLSLAHAIEVAHVEAGGLEHRVEVDLGGGHRAAGRRKVRACCRGRAARNRGWGPLPGSGLTGELSDQLGRRLLRVGALHRRAPFVRGPVF